MNGSHAPMYISKPKTPEDLYKFFAYGMPLTPINIYPQFTNCIRRKGWNVLMPSDKDQIRLWVDYYPTWKDYSALWKLKEYQYVEHD